MDYQRSAWFVPAVVFGAAVMLLSTPASSRATTILSNDQLAQQFGSAVVSIEAKDKPGSLGFGVVVSLQGHVLSLAHVIGTLPPDAIVGRVFRTGKVGDPEKLSEIARLPLEDGDAFVLLKFDSAVVVGVSPPPLSKITKSAYGPFRVLTRSANYIEQPTPIDTSPSGEDAKLLERLGFIDAGASGAPLLDKWGSMVGVVLKGRSLQGISYVRKVEDVEVWLRSKDVPLIERSSPPESIAIYLRNAELSSTAAVELIRDIKAPLVDTFETARQLMKLPPKVYTQKIDQLEKISSIIFDQSLSYDKQKSAIEGFLSEPEQMGWLNGRDYGLLYLLLIDIHDASLLNFALLEINNQITKASADFSTSVIQLSSKPDPASLRSTAMELLYQLIRIQPRFGSNGWLMADCFKLIGSDLARGTSAFFPTIFGDRLKGVGPIIDLSGKRYQIRWAESDVCMDTLAATSRLFVRDHLSEILIRAWILPAGDTTYILRWGAAHPWDDDVSHHYETTMDKPITGSLTLGNFPNVAQDLAAEVVKKWPNVLERIGQ